MFVVFLSHSLLCALHYFTFTIHSFSVHTHSTHLTLDNSKHKCIIAFYNWTMAGLAIWSSSKERWMIEVSFVWLCMWMWHSWCEGLIAWVSEWLRVCVWERAQKFELQRNGWLPEIAFIFLCFVFIFMQRNTDAVWVMAQLATSSVSQQIENGSKTIAQQATMSCDFFIAFSHMSHTHSHFIEREPPSLFS